MSKQSNTNTLVIDTETTGLPPRYAPPHMLEAWETCRIVQIAWEVYDENGNHINSECYIIRPNGFVIPVESSQIHGIQHEHAEKHGSSLMHVLERLMHLLPSIARIVAHNMNFDDNVVQSEVYRLGCPFSKELLNEWNSKEKICTMKAGTAPGKKWPKLAELYAKCFGAPPSGTMHRADEDVRACADIYHFQSGIRTKTL